MYILKPGIKKDQQRRWALPDRIFFGHGACHILAGVFLDMQPLSGFHAQKIIPAEGFAGNHIFVTNGVVAFDFHGYTARERLVEHHCKVWRTLHRHWDHTIETVDFDLLDTAELNQRKMLGPDQYLHDPVPRAQAFIHRRDHKKGLAKVLATIERRRPSPLGDSGR